MIVLSLFDGISCGRVALERVGITPTVYYASEIEKSAIAITRHNWPQTIQLGDVIHVRKLAESGFFGDRGIDLLIGGSPCQGFSNAGLQGAFNDPRSALFFEFVRIKNALKPKFFMLENVNMRREWRDVITAHMGVDPVFINSADFCAANRRRWYWSNISVAPWQPCGAVLRDIIENPHLCIDKKTINFSDDFYGSSKGVRSRRYVREGLRNLDEKARGLTKQNAANATATGGTAVVFFDGCKFTWRVLTNLECERLQGLPDGYTNVDKIGKGKRGNAIGNGWQVDTVAHIFKGLNT